MNLNTCWRLVIVSFLLFQNVGANNLKPVIKDSCLEQNVTIKAEFKSKSIYFFFRRTNHKKVKRIDKAVNKDGKVLLTITMKSTEKGDVYDFKKFHRLVIIDNQIHEVTVILGKEKGKLILYNFCGEKVSEQSVDSEELLEKYNFKFY
ncbi:hypothetical protein [Flavobacterium gelatinilyticum]|uniref:hypothetical protein n=1 Tax=Flavobacterium gelatinilyticum TaxID=3003260 RepID=UPI0024812C64|nr:hypothetical protein [Flavobacterium gelatinilyticum]